MSRNLRNLFCLSILLCLAAGAVVSVFGQDKKPPKQPRVKDYVPMPGPEPPGYFHGDGQTTERSMIVDPNVALKLCVAEGELKVNGWHRDEVRVFVRNGRNFRFKPLEKSPQTGKVNWLWVGNMVEGRPGPSAECLAGESVEIDVPVTASLDLSGREVRTSIDSLKKVTVRVLAGSIALRNITGGITAQTNRGDMIVENSAGSIALTGFTGNINVIDVKAGQIGDFLTARTNSGAVTMQRVEHRQIQANSISGQLYFEGKFLPGGIYTFRTATGSISLRIPAASSCTLTATYGQGNFTTDLSHKILTQNITPQAKIMVTKIGAGDATVNLTATNGSISIKKAADKP